MIVPNHGAPIACHSWTIPWRACKPSTSMSTSPGTGTGTFTFTRAGDLTFSLTVTYTIGGTAVNNGDYDFITTNVTFAAGVAILW